MNIGFIGLGKLGLPVALAVENAGYTVYGYDINPEVEKILQTRELPYQEVKAPDLLINTRIKFSSKDAVVEKCDLIFMPIQTPHQPEFEGITPIPKERADFDYSYLIEGVKSIAQVCEEQQKHITLVIISTVLPGTTEKYLKPLLNEYIKLVYNPFFIAMGTVIDDFLNPEFVLIGADDEIPEVEKFYATIHAKPLFKTSIKTAELIKVSYNTFIGMKIVFANTIMEICHKTGAHSDDVTKALSLATERVISPKYLRGGMGDGGGCHPRDNIAMSWLAKELDLSHNFFEDIMKAREDQTNFLIELIEKHKGDLPVKILGKEFKPDTNLTTGSPSLLLSSMMEKRKIEHKFVDIPFGKALYFFGTQHPWYPEMNFPEGSVVIDPFRYIPDQQGITVIRVGE